MLHGSLLDFGTYAAFTGHPVWQTALGWLRSLPRDIADGTYEISGPEMRASVQSYETQARELCRFESHVDFIDIQFTISGVEGIDWSPRSLLEKEGAFGNDVQFWRPPADGYTTLLQSAGRFAVFFPEDAHRPKVQSGQSAPVKKVVIKIHRSLFGPK